MDEQLLATFQRLIDAGIEVIPATDIQNHLVVAKGDYAALIRIANGRLVGIGAPGKMTTKGFAPLIGIDQEPAFVVKGYREPATKEDVEQTRIFAAELNAAITPVAS